MSCQHTRTSTVTSVTCCEPWAEARRPPGPAPSSTPSTTPSAWPLWSGWSGLPRCCSPRRTSIYSLPGKDKNWLDGKQCWRDTWCSILHRLDPILIASTKKAASRRGYQAASSQTRLPFQVTYPWKVPRRPDFGTTYLWEVRRSSWGLWEVDRRNPRLVNLFVSYKLSIVVFTSNWSYLVSLSDLPVSGWPFLHWGTHFRAGENWWWETGILLAVEHHLLDCTGFAKLLLLPSQTFLNLTYSILIQPRRVYSFTDLSLTHNNKCFG